MTDINTSNAIAQDRARIREKRMEEEFAELSEQLYRAGRSVGFGWGVVAGIFLFGIVFCVAIIYHSIV